MKPRYRLVTVGTPSQNMAMSTAHGATQRLLAELKDLQKEKWVHIEVSIRW